MRGYGMTCRFLIGACFALFAFVFLAGPVFAVTGERMPEDLTHHPLAIATLFLFCIAYFLVILEEWTKMRKSKPMLLCAGIIWAIVAWIYSGTHAADIVGEHFREHLLDYAELLLFLLVAMTYISAMDERRLFLALKAWLIDRKFSLRGLFWMTGILSFIISPFADNLTTAILMCSVVMAVGDGNKKFVGIACVNIVVAANAGGAFSPFGDITTLMVWQSGKVNFTEFFVLFFPSLLNFLVPAAIMHFFVEKGMPGAKPEKVEIKRGGFFIVGLFALTVLTSVAFYTWFDLPPAAGMMMGLSYLQFFGYFLRKTLPRSIARKAAKAQVSPDEFVRMGNIVPFDVFNRVAHAEWDTLIFFYGVVMCIGGLSFMGYLELLSINTYTAFGPTIANSLIGVFSAVLDNIPLMFAVLQMDPDMEHGQWLLVTLTAGVGGSLLATGSAAGVALLGHARGQYTFMSHLKWAPAIAVGYIVSIWVHLWLNSGMM